MKAAWQNNYETLIIAGLGAVGSGLLKLGLRELRGFRQVILVDLDEGALVRHEGEGFLCRQGSVEDAGFLRRLISSVGAGGLLVNLCSSTDNVRVRRCIAPFDVCYLDSCASMAGDHRFSRMMDYTFTPVASRRPHWLCWGINPGLVELVTRKIIRDAGWAGRDLAVTVFEQDQLSAAPAGPEIAVSWCPEALIEEVMLAPTLEIRDGLPVEAEAAGARPAVSFWAGEAVASRVVAHEDIWNMGRIEGVREARFLYGLAPRVMQALAGETGSARQRLRLPGPESAVFGQERIAVQVREIRSGAVKTLVWQTDHHEVWKRYGVNGVQYQTAKSLLFALRLLQQTDYGRRAGTYCASDLPVAPGDWACFETIFQELGIDWCDGGHLNLSCREEGAGLSAPSSARVAAAGPGKNPVPAPQPETAAV